MTAALAILLTVNMIIERREFLEMLTEMETARSTLNRDFKTALAGIQQLSEQVKEADHAYDEGVRVLAADIHSHAERLDRLAEGVLYDRAVRTPRRAWDPVQDPKSSPPDAK